jgi:hypothetical protein
LVEDAVVTTTGTYSATSSDNSGYWVMQLAAFRVAQAAVDTTPPSIPTGVSATTVSGIRSM